MAIYTFNIWSMVYILPMVYKNKCNIVYLTLKSVLLKFEFYVNNLIINEILIKFLYFSMYNM